MSPATVMLASAGAPHLRLIVIVLIVIAIFVARLIRRRRRNGHSDR